MRRTSFDDLVRTFGMPAGRRAALGALLGGLAAAPALGVNAEDGADDEASPRARFAGVGGNGGNGGKGGNARRGRRGRPGPTGPVGPTGPAGGPGSAGGGSTTGPTGPAGPPGPTGPTGQTGPEGPRGLGAQGPQGAQGPAGPPGVVGPLTERQKTIRVTGSSGNDGSVECPDAQLAITCGYRCRALSGFAARIRVTTLIASGRSCSAVFFNEDPSPFDVDCDIVAQCG